MRLPFGASKSWRPQRQLLFKPAMIVGCILAISGVMFMFRSSAATIAETDLNGDGVVNLTDMSMLLSNFNTANTVGDINHDGTVNLTDLSMLLTNYGKSVPTTPPTTPPPTTPPPTTPPPTIPPPVTPPPDNPTPFGSVTGPITNQLSDMCLEVESGSADPSSDIIIEDCDNSAGQQWTIAFSADGSAEIKAFGMCLTALETSLTVGLYGTLMLGTCDGGAYTKWLVSRPNNGFVQIISPGLTAFNNGGYACLDLHGSGASTDAGTLARSYMCIVENTSILWAVPSNAPSSGISSFGFTSNTAKCLDLPSGATTPGTQLQVWDCNDQPPQRFTLGNDTPNGRSKLTVLGKCVEVKDNGTADGTAVQINTCTNTTAQDWTATKTGTSYTFKHTKSGKCLDTASGTVANSALMVIKTCGSATGQQFTAR